MNAVIGRNAGLLREKAGLTQTQVGEALKRFTGRAWSRSEVWRLEHGQRTVEAGVLLGLAAALRATVAELLAPEGEDFVLPSNDTLTREEVLKLVMGTNDPERTLETVHTLDTLRDLLGRLGEE